MCGDSLVLSWEKGENRKSSQLTLCLPLLTSNMMTDTADGG
jgi:hypothetical protein